MSFGLLVLRLVLGLVMAGHGAQKLFGWFGGGGPRGTGAMFGQLRFRYPVIMAVVAGLGEFGGGLLLASGLLTPLAAVAIAGVMINAVVTVHLRNGLWATQGGYEYNLVILTAAVAIAAISPGRYSLDALIGWADDISGVWWGVGALVVAAVLSAVTLGFGRVPPAATPEADAGRSETETETSSNHASTRTR